MVYDQAQSPRLGQRTQVESTYVQMFDVDPTTPTADLVEAAWPGQLIFRRDLSILQIFNGDAGAWEDVAGGVAGQLTFVGTFEPTGGTYSVGDVWYNSSTTPYVQSVWDGTAWVKVGAGSRTTISTTPPAGSVLGDTWVNQNNYQPYVYDGAGWQYTTPAFDQITRQVAQTLADQLRSYFGALAAHRVVYYGPDAPVTGVNLHDVWCDTDISAVYDYTAAGWQLVTAEGLRLAVSGAGVARFIQDSRINVYSQATAPTGLDGTDIGDIWHALDLGAQAKIWSGNDWADLQVGPGGIADQVVGNEQITDGSVDAAGKLVLGSIRTPQLADNVITNDKISDFAVAARQLSTQTHIIY